MHQMLNLCSIGLGSQQESETGTADQTGPPVAIYQHISYMLAPIQM